MLDFKHSFNDINSFIEHLKTKEEVIGVVEYGGRSYLDSSIGGDYDLTVILEKPLSNNLNGVHFHIGEIPVDCMILSVDDFLTDTPITHFLLVHLNCVILYERGDTLTALLNKIKVNWSTPNELSDFEKYFFRFAGRHNLDKLEHRLFEDPLYSKYLIFSSFDFYLQFYSRINNLEVGKSKLYLKHIKENSPDLYKLVQELYDSNDLKRMFDILKECAILIIKPIGSIWEKNELLLHLLPNGKFNYQDEINVIELLFK